MSKARQAKPPSGASPQRSIAHRLIGPPLVAIVATVASLVTLAPETGGPGITCDELYHVEYGKRLVTAFRHQGLSFFRADHIRANFPWSADGPPVHPPLGNWILGWTHYLFDPEPDNPGMVTLVAARFAPAMAYGLLVLLVGLSSGRGEGPLVGSAAAAAVALVPRVFGHGHLAALDTISTLFFVAATLALIEADRLAPARSRHFAFAGVVWGLAMLTRLHGVLLMPPVAVWLLWRRRRRAIVPLAWWGTSGAATLFAGWPWLWLAPVAHLKQFLGSATQRQAIHVYYIGRVWEDTQVPWHYPLVMFVLALPVGLFLLGVVGSYRSVLPSSDKAFQPIPDRPLLSESGVRTQARKVSDRAGHRLVILTIGVLLGVFAWPGTPVYDGVRLFLMAFPLWAILVGTGAGWVVSWPIWRRYSLAARWRGMGLFIALQGVGLIAYHPCQLSHYSLLAGGLAGAERMGFEVTYWGDSVLEPLLAEAADRAAGGRILLAPNLAPFQNPAVQISSRSLTEAEVEVVGWDPARREMAAGCRLAVLYNRKADLAAIPHRWWDGEILVQQRQQGVWLTRLVRLPETIPPSAGHRVEPERGSK